MKNKTIISKMSLAQKAALMSGKNIWETVGYPELGIPSIFLADGPHGVRKQLGAADHLGLNESVPATCFPTAATLANSWDEDLIAQVGEGIGAESAANDVHVLLGPGLNLKRNPLCGRNFEYFSEDPYQAGKLAAAYIRGLQSQGIAACPKHLAVNSQESRRMASNSVIDERTFQELYLTAFEIAVKEGNPLALMSAYNEINGVYANEDYALLRDILVEQWGFNGFVVSDWGGSNDHVKGVANGSHLEMPSTSFNGQQEIVDAVNDGRLPEQILDERVDELLSVVLAVANKPNVSPAYAEHHQLAKKAASESIVLLKNTQDTLPLLATKKVAVIGEFAASPRYQGAGSSVVNPTQLDNTLDLIENSSLNYIGYAQGYHRVNRPDSNLIKEAVDLAKQADCVLLYVGLDEISESEGLDRQTIDMPANQLSLIKAVSQVNSNVIAIISAGSVVDLSWDQDVAAVLHGYLGGQAGAGAMIDVITGQTTPSGKLSETYPLSYADLPSAGNYPEKGRHALYKEGIYVGYRYFETRRKSVKYPFGYGLSYTKFNYRDIQVSETSVTFTLENVGKIAGSEIVQLYVSKESEHFYRANKELKGFSKITLQPGEKTEVTISFDDKTFRYYNTATKQWEIEGGTYELLIGASVADIRLKATYTCQGTTDNYPEQDQTLATYLSGDVQNVSLTEFSQLLGRPIPEENTDKAQELGLNDPLLQMQYAKSFLARFVFRLLSRLLARSERKGKPNLNLLFNYNMPFRAIGKMTNGLFNSQMVTGIVVIVNGNFIRGMKQILNGNKLRKKVKKMNESTIT